MTYHLCVLPTNGNRKGRSKLIFHVQVYQTLIQKSFNYKNQFTWCGVFFWGARNSIKIKREKLNRKNAEHAIKDDSETSILKSFRRYFNQMNGKDIQFLCYNIREV